MSAQNDTLPTFESERRRWLRFDCDGSCNDGQSDVCSCPFRFACEQCGREIKTDGEGMTTYVHYVGGVCESCSAAG